MPSFSLVANDIDDVIRPAADHVIPSGADQISLKAGHAGLGIDAGWQGTARNRPGGRVDKL